MYTPYESRAKEIIFTMKFWVRFSEMLHTGSPHPAQYCSRASTLPPERTKNTERPGRSRFLQWKTHGRWTKRGKVWEQIWMHQNSTRNRQQPTEQEDDSWWENTLVERSHGTKWCWTSITKGTTRKAVFSIFQCVLYMLMHVFLDRFWQRHSITATQDSQSLNSIQWSEHQLVDRMVRIHLKKVSSFGKFCQIGQVTNEIEFRCAKPQVA